MTKSIIDLAVKEKPENREINKTKGKFLELMVIEAGPSVEDQDFSIGTELSMERLTPTGTYLQCVECSTPGEAYSRCNGCEYNTK